MNHWKNLLLCSNLVQGGSDGLFEEGYLIVIVLRHDVGTKGLYKRPGCLYTYDAEEWYFTGRIASEEEQEMTTEDLYETCDEETDMYTFTIV